MVLQIHFQNHWTPTAMMKLSKGMQHAKSAVVGVFFQFMGMLACAAGSKGGVMILQESEICIPFELVRFARITCVSVF